MNLLLDKQDHSPPPTALASLPNSLVTHAGRLVHLESEIGRGGDSTVYKASYEGRSESVAVKIFDASVARQEKRMQRLHEELEIAQRVDSPRLMAAFDAGIAFGQHFMVMEYASGGNLEAYLDAHAPLSIQQIQSLGLELCEAVGDLHRHNIIHRDLKPQNVLLMGDGSLKLADFGLARQTFDGQVSSTVSTVGTMGYIAPEQALGEPVGPYTDIYALGVTLFVMSTNRLPFEAATSFAVALAHVKESPPAPSRYRHGLPRKFDAIVLRCLSKDPKRRYSAASQLCEALADMLDGQSDSRWSRWLYSRSSNQSAPRELNGATVFGR